MDSNDSSRSASGQSSPLLRHAAILDKLYDAEALFCVKESVASGFIVLLGGFHGNSNGGRLTTDDNDNGVSLGFLALTQGNVLDACFGIEGRRSNIVSQRGSSDRSPAQRIAAAGKEMLDDAARERDDIRTIAVTTYREAFETVLEYHDKIDRLNCFTRCFFYRPIATMAEKELSEIFSKLAEAIAETNASHS